MLNRSTVSLMEQLVTVTTVLRGEKGKKKREEKRKEVKD